MKQNTLRVLEGCSSVIIQIIGFSDPTNKYVVSKIL